MFIFIVKKKWCHRHFKFWFALPENGFPFTSVDLNELWFREDFVFLGSVPIWLLSSLHDRALFINGTVSWVTPTTCVYFTRGPNIFRTRVFSWCFSLWVMWGLWELPQRSTVATVMCSDSWDVPWWRICDRKASHYLMKHSICITQSLSPPSESGSSDGLYLLMEIDSGSSGSPPPPFVHQTWPHHFFSWLNVLVFSSGAFGWVVSCLLTTPAPTTSSFFFFPEKTDPLLQTAVLTARRGEMESSHPLLQAVLYSNCLHVKFPIQPVD